jgi:hypothetical protein
MAILERSWGADVSADTLDTCFELLLWKAGSNAVAQQNPPPT